MRRLPNNPNHPLKKRLKPVSDYLTQISQRDNRLWKLINGELVTMYNGQYITSKEFDKLYPVNYPVSFLRSKENVNKNNNYLN